MYLYIIVIIIIIIIILLIIGNKKCNIILNHSGKECQHSHYVYNSIQLSKLKDLIVTFDKFTQDYNITYFIIGGTLLGAARQNGFMSWDDDVDYGIINTDNNKLLQLQKDLINSNSKYKLVDFDLFGYKFMFTDDCCHGDDGKNESHDVFIDIMMFKKQNNKYVLEKENFLTDMWKAEWHYEDELFPLQKVFFSGLYLPKPKYEINYLDRTYDKWRTWIYISKTMHNSQKVNTDTYDAIEINNNNRNKYLCYNNLLN
jgi:phosphorylcholine metabolism protein LicD